MANRKWKTKTNNLYARKIPTWRNKEKRKKKLEVRFFKPVSDYSLVFNASANTSV